MAKQTIIFRVLIIILILPFVSVSQTVTLKFTGKDVENHYVQLSRVSITNLTKSWQETIWWPDTVLTMQNGTGINDYYENGGFLLLQNNPNPFSGTTDVSLIMSEEGQVFLDITDVNGRIIAEKNYYASLLPGVHQFQISVSSVGTYVMTAHQNGKISSIKMICNKGCETNNIDYLGTAQSITYVLKSTTDKPFNFGDMMEYVGYATINNSEEESQRITHAQGASQTFTLQFAVSQQQVPTIATASVSNITFSSATCGGDVFSDGGSMVTARGVCWSTYQNPNMNDSHTSDGGGIGSFASNITGLTTGTTYYVRAYATNSMGTAYGDLKTFTTMSEDPPTVTTSSVSNITSSSAACGGTVSSSGSFTVTSRGVCWSTFQNPTVSEAHTSDGSGTGSFTSDISGLTAGTTYYVRAYATNSAGTAYGVQKTFSTTTVTPPVISTSDVSNITTSSATCGGYVSSSGGATMIARGVCWSTSQNPTLSDSHTSNGSGTGSFISDISGLTAGTTYYVRAYATNSVGTSYGEQKTFTTISVTSPIVTTSSVNNITNSSVTCGGNVSSDGGDVVTARGVCWSTLQSPTVSDSHTIDGNGLGSFTSDITGLSAGTTYYVRAYATNSVGTSYGTQKTFTTISVTPPIVTTSSVSNITNSSATCGGVVSSDGGGVVTARGVCWSTLQNPTVSDSHTIDGNGLGSFTSDISGLSADSTYYVRAYATNSAGTAYGMQQSFTVSIDSCYLLLENFDGGDIPADWTYIDGDGDGYNWVYSLDVLGTGQGHNGSSGCMLSQSYINNLGALSPNNWLISPAITLPNNATLSFWVCAQDASYPAEHYGVYVTTSNNYLNLNNYNLLFEETLDANGGTRVQGSWKQKMVDLQAYAGQIVHIAFRHFNCTDMFYLNIDDVAILYNCSDSNEGQPCINASTVMDYDGNLYNTVQIGNQCWMKENMRALHYDDGTSIELGNSASAITAYYYYPQNNSTNFSVYGALYNWPAVMRYASSSNNNPSGVQGICPSGWHVPSDLEWTQLTNYISSQTQYICGNDASNIAKALASNIGWNTSSDSCSVGNASETNNATGFGAMPAGGYYGVYYGFGGHAVCWSSTEGSSSGVLCWNIRNSDSCVYRPNYSKHYAYSVRCLRDETGSSSTASLPTVITTNVSSITDNSAVVNGNVVSDGGAAVTVYGICWSSNQDPTINDNHTSDGNGTGGFSSVLSGLIANTTYYVRAYATNSIGTAYGNVISFTTTSPMGQDGDPCPNAATVTDFDGNVYNTVQIGNQCWMKTNLRTTHYANGVEIPLGTSVPASSTVAYYYTAPYIEGYFYNWKAVMKNQSPSYSNPSGVQGICPYGWHVPSHSEWLQLINYVSSQSQYENHTQSVCGASSYVAKALASAAGWYQQGLLNTCVPGKHTTYNNATKFGAYPSGEYYDGAEFEGKVARIWSTSPLQEANYQDYVHCLYLWYNSTTVHDEYGKAGACSVRCLKD